MVSSHPLCATAGGLKALCRTAGGLEAQADGLAPVMAAGGEGKGHTREISC